MPFLQLVKKNWNDSSGIVNYYIANTNYRYGFTGKENDKNIDENNFDCGFRMYNPQIGGFLSIDPLTASYLWFTQYQFAGISLLRMWILTV